MLPPNPETLLVHRLLNPQGDLGDGALVLSRPLTEAFVSSSSVFRRIDRKVPPFFSSCFFGE